MKIKTKLIISFCIIIFVPVFLATIAIVGFCNIQTHVIEETYGIKNANAYSIMSSVQLLNKYTVGDFEKIKHTIKQNSEELLDIDSSIISKPEKVSIIMVERITSRCLIRFQNMERPARTQASEFTLIVRKMCWSSRWISRMQKIRR